MIKIKTYVWNKELRNLAECLVEPTYWYDEENRLLVSAEDGLGLADYYGEFYDGFPWVHPDLEHWAAKQGSHWEWVNPGAIMLCHE